MHYAVSHKTATEIIYSRADVDKERMEIFEKNDTNNKDNFVIIISMLGG